MTEPRAQSIADVLNESCECVTMDDALLERALVEQGASFGVEALLRSHPQLFSRAAVFASRATLSEMTKVVEAVERVVALPGYQELALHDAPRAAHVTTAARGAFLGFDFHLSHDGPQLIEINTNAGGGILNAILRKAQRACCPPVASALERYDDAVARFVAMFEAEWRLAGRRGRLARLAIIDDEPEQQFLYPEFVLFARICRAHGIEAVIGDARALRIQGDRLVLGDAAIDLVYNRLTDFSLEAPEHAALAKAFREGLAVVTPHPRAHALYADKKRLVTLSDASQLAALGASDADIAVLVRHVPRTVVVDAREREALWRERKQLFFKPQSGYGSKAAYRGDKLTKGVFEQILREPYVAQRLVPPSSRNVCLGEASQALKVDVRAFAYAAEVQLVCARLYQGQTTNFRTQGGGFAPVYETPS